LQSEDRYDERRLTRNAALLLLPSCAVVETTSALE
jgi:hypothetical protein